MNLLLPFKTNSPQVSKMPLPFIPKPLKRHPLARLSPRPKVSKTCQASRSPKQDLPRNSCSNQVQLCRRLLTSSTLTSPCPRHQVLWFRTWQSLHPRLLLCVTIMRLRLRRQMTSLATVAITMRQGQPSTRPPYSRSKMKLMSMVSHTLIDKNLRQTNNCG